MKIGILSFYYRNHNYGGLLQAYALTQSIQKLGYEAEQVSFDCWSPLTRSLTDSKRERFRKSNAFGKIRIVFASLSNRVKNRIPKKKTPELSEVCKEGLKKRAVAFDVFQDAIPHSQTTYNEKNIAGCATDYDFFVVGSDQVWNSKLGRLLYFLDFLPYDCKKGMSYAASIADTKLNERQKKAFRENLQKFIAVSVREPDSVGLLQEIVKTDVQWVADPTMLLSSADWDLICTGREVLEDYIFCYFLGENKRAIRAVKKFAKEKNLKIVTLPFIHNQYRTIDDEFGNVKLFDVAPNQFISLIKYANFIFTDSYHAAVFSNIYEKPFFVFKRNKNEMISRIYGLLQIFDEENRFCNKPSRMKSSYFEAIENCKHKKSTMQFEKFIERSKEYLVDNLKKAKGFNQ